jgi:hypothetical protein
MNNIISCQRAPCLLSIVIAASCALLFAIATDELFNGLNMNGEIAVGLCVESPVLLNIWEFPHRSRQSSYHIQFILTNIDQLEICITCNLVLLNSPEMDTRTCSIRRSINHLTTVKL